MTSRTSNRMRAVALAGPTAAVLILGMAVPAGAAVTIPGGSSIQGDAANDFINVSCVGGVLAAGGATGDPCATLTEMSVDGGAGTDTVNLQAVTAADFPALSMIGIDVEESGAAEADDVTGSDLNELINGDSLDTVSGRGGHDLIDGANSASGGAGDDSFMNIDSFASGGPGDDRFIQLAVAIDGGDGMDSWEIDFDQLQLAVPNDPAVSFVLSPTMLVVDIADDGMPPAEVPATGLDQVYFTLLRQGPQSWDGATFAGSQHVRGMAGVDTLTGGAHDDALHGGTGNDLVTGNAGVDVLHGGDDNDTIQARDGFVDRVDCGAGTDTVVADAADVLAGCESVDVPAVAPPVVPPVAPETSAIKGKSKVTKPKTAKFRFSSPTPGATFECKLDKGKWKKCSSTHKVKTKKLKTGKHKLRVRAVAGGLVDSTPSKKTFKVKRRP